MASQKFSLTLTLTCAEIDCVVTREAKQKWRFCDVLIHCVISCKIAEFRQ